jgi:hypothetical protein
MFKFLLIKNLEKLFARQGRQTRAESSHEKMAAAWVPLGNDTELVLNPLSTPPRRHFATVVAWIFYFVAAGRTQVGGTPAWSQWRTELALETEKVILPDLGAYILPVELIIFLTACRA